MLDWLAPSLSQTLRALGFEQMLVVRGCTHLALWFSAIISFGFTIIWFTDLIEFRRMTSYQMWFEAIGVVIFFASFRDAVRMIAVYDDDNQNVLQQKWKVLDALKLESHQSLEAAKANVEKLRGSVVKVITEEISNYTREVFSIILPGLYGQYSSSRLTEKDGQELLALGMRFAELARAVLVEVDDLTAAMIVDLASDHPAVYEKLAIMDDEGARGHYLDLWDEWMMFEFPHFAGKRPDKDKAVDDLTKSLKWARTEDKGVQDRKRLAERNAERVMTPLERLLSLPDAFQKYATTLESSKIVSFEQLTTRKKRVGCGCPPWGRGCACCIPYTMASQARVFCFPFLSCCCSGRQSCLESGLHYQSGGNPKPKRCSFFGLFWIQVFTKLQERLLQGLFFSILYLVIYVWTILLVRNFTKCKALFTSIATHQECAGVILRKLSAAISLVTYIPSLCVCL